MKKAWLVRVLVLCYLIYCVFVVTSENIKYIQEENVLVQINYFIGFILCWPVAILAEIIPEAWLLQDGVTTLLHFMVGGIFALLLVFYVPVLGFFESDKSND